MSKIPDNLKYTESHEWVRVDENEIVTIGITDYAQENLGDLVYVEAPEVGTELDVKDESGVVESVKSAEDLYSPLAGEVIEANDALGDAPELVNNSPYDEGWLFKMKLADSSDLDKLLSAAEYANMIAEAANG